MMFFNHPKVRAYLMKHGQVYSLRGFRRKREGGELLVAGALYGPKQKLARGRVHWVKSWRNVKAKQLAPYVERSGLKTGGEWIEALKAMNGGTVPPVVHLYEIVVLSRLDELAAPA